MAPVQVIDLTSSPEPDDSPARVAALSRFQPLREKSQVVNRGIPTIPVNGLPLFYDNSAQWENDDNVRHVQQELEDVLPGAAAGANNGTTGSIAPGALEESVATEQRAYGSSSHVSSRQVNNGTILEPPAYSHIADLRPTNLAGIAHEGTRVLPNGHGLAQEAPVSGDGQHQWSLPRHRQLSSNESCQDPHSNGFSQTAAPQVPPAYHALIDYVRPLNGISSECRARLYGQRHALAGTPLGYAIEQDILKTHKDSAEAKKKEICPNCSRAFFRSEKMQRHRRRCEARDAARSSHQSPDAALQAPPLLVSQQQDLTVPQAMSYFNPLKRALQPSDSNGSKRPSGKKARADPISPEPQRRPPSRLRLVNMTDDGMEGIAFSDESNSQAPGASLPDDNRNSTAIAYVSSQPVDDLSSGPSRNGLPYSAEEDALLLKLREIDKLPFSSIAGRFAGRTQDALKFRDHTLRTRKLGPTRQVPGRSAHLEIKSSLPTKRIRKPNIPSGLVPWASVNKARAEENQIAEAQRESKRRKQLREQSVRDIKVAETEVEIGAAEGIPSNAGKSGSGLSSKDAVYPSSMSRILRLRELGVRGRRAWTKSSHPVPDELKDHIFSDYGLQQEYQGTSGDVISLAWNESNRFAASSIAIADQQSMQYNMHRNLLVGDTERVEVRELLEHHIPRPEVRSTTNINSNHAMRQSQDPRLFLSVVAAKFCPQDSTRLFTAGMDKALRHYNVERDQVTCRYAVKHTSPVALLSIGAGHGLVATGCHQSSRSINVFSCGTQSYDVKLELSPRQSNVAVYPSALKWGVAHHHQNFLLAGFSGEEDVVSCATGETCLWDVSSGQRIQLGGATRNVFDVTWNPIPSSSSIAFAVAGNANGHVVDKGMRTVVQCFAAGQKGGRGVLDWQSPCLDVNDLVFCPYDDNLIAAGATNGCVYIWDKRSADRSQRPLHTLRHGESLNVLDHDRNAEVADTGVQFLAWGPTKNRLYSGSSDGIVKVWNPYRSPDNAHVSDISGPSRDRSAVMSGAFSPDFQELLIGTENGRINLFKSGSDAVSHRRQQFKVIPGPEPEREPEKEQQEPFAAARSLLQNCEIELRPCGAMPFRQAVQGPNYQGPFLNPSKALRREADERLDRARDTQLRLGDENGEGDFTKAAKEVDIAEEEVTDLRRRKDLARTLLPKAEAFQRKLAEFEGARRELEALVGSVERCKLDCAVLPQHDDDDDNDVEDSGRSELRIPGFMQFIANASPSDEVSSTCTGCTSGRPNINSKAQRFCTACVLKRARLTSACTKCGKAARPTTEEGKPTVCEQCAFGCIRCGMSVVIAQNSGSVQCGPCGLEWEMGVLGYDLMQTFTLAPKHAMEILRVEDDEDDLMQIGDEDRDFYSRKWGATETY